METPSALPAELRSNHARYDAGLLQASRKTQRDIMRKRLLDPSYSHHFDPHHTKPCNVPWFLVPKTQYDVTLTMYQQDTLDRVTQTLRSTGTIDDRDLRQPDVQRFIQHWTHKLLLRSIAMHTPRGDMVYTEEEMLAGTRKTLLDTARCVNRPMSAESPAHPLWGKRGGFQKDNAGVNLWVMEGTAQQEKIARHLAGPALAHLTTPECRASDIARVAVPELLSFDRTDIIERQARQRMQLRFALRGHETFTPELKEHVIDELTEIWVTLNESLTGEMLALQRKYGGPSPLDGDIADVFDAYVGKYIREPHLHRERLQECMPLVVHLTIRSVLEKQHDHVAAFCIVWDQLATVCEFDPSVTDLAFMIFGVFRDQVSPQALMNNL
jgi:hypothetical protein